MYCAEYYPTYRNIGAKVHYFYDFSREIAHIVIYFVSLVLKLINCAEKIYSNKFCALINEIECKALIKKSDPQYGNKLSDGLKRILWYS